MRAVFLAAAIATLTFSSNILAEEARIDVASRRDISESRYEKLSGTVRLGGQRAAEHPTPFFALRPKNAIERNGAALIEVANELLRPMLRAFNHAGPNPDPESSADLGDGFLMKYGFTLAWVNSEAALTAFAASMKSPEASISAEHVYVIESSASGPVLREFVSNRASQSKVFRIETGGAGAAPRAPQDNVRTFLFVGAAPMPARFPPARIDDRQFENTVDYWWSMRALLLAFHRWVSANRQPPQGGEVALPDIAAPLGTYTPSAFIPFSRGVIAERYRSRENYLARVRDAADLLVRGGYLLYDDVDRVVQRADDTWDLAFDSR